MERFIISILIFGPVLSFSQKIKLPENAYKPAIEIGQIAQNFTSFTLDRKELSLKEVLSNNKITLVEFWASWCGSCRQEIPFIKKVYYEFHDKGFEILGVSLDFNEKNWRSIVERDSIPWINVSELSGRNESAAKIYKINALPAALLIDKNGKILQLDLPGSVSDSYIGSLHGENLNNAIKKFLAKYE